MQTNTLKIISVIFLSVFSFAFSSFGQDFSRDLEVADSLFKARKYTESFGIYEAILETGEHVSPAMLLKMAYIKEGLNNTSEALYYLNLYYLKTSNDQVLNKMEELAEKEKVQGYKQSDVDVLATFYYKNFTKLIGLLTIITLLSLGLLIYRSRNATHQPYFAGVSFVVLLAILFYTANYGKPNNQAIIIKAGAYIMSGPSAGSDVLDTPIKGHKVKTIGTEDVWTKIQWNNETGYVKSSYLKKLYF